MYYGGYSHRLELISLDLCHKEFGDLERIATAEKLRIWKYFVLASNNKCSPLNISDRKKFAAWSCLLVQP